MSEIDFHKIREYYGENGIFIPGSWKTYSDKKFSPLDAKIVFRNLQDSGIIPPAQKDFTFLSPTANTATHERAMWEEDKNTRTGKSTFVVGDLSVLIRKQPLDTDSNHLFQSIYLNAFQLPLGNGCIDLIFDRKGWIWHCAANIEYRQYLLPTLAEYQRVLAPGGSIVFDAMQGFSKDAYAMLRTRCLQIEDDQLYGRKPQFTPNQLFYRDVSQYEESTLDLLMLRSTEWMKILQRFTYQPIGRGAHQIAVLTPKTDSSVFYSG
jgi:SAM-dependent methyltransferase